MMKGLELGHFIAEFISVTVASDAAKVSNTTGTSLHHATLNLATFLGWTSFSAVMMAMARSVIAEAVADQITDTVNGNLVQIYSTSYNMSWALLQNRYEGYWKAYKDNSNPGGPGFNMAKYFIACCRQGDRYVDYERLIVDPDELERVPQEELNLETVRQLRELKARGQHATYTLGLELSQTAGLLGSYFSAWHEAVESLLQQHA